MTLRTGNCGGAEEVPEKGERPATPGRGEGPGGWAAGPAANEPSPNPSAEQLRTIPSLSGAARAFPASEGAGEGVPRAR